MRAVRKRYRITVDGIQSGPLFRSQSSAYDHIGTLASTGVATVWVDESHGRGWEKFETIDLAELAGKP